MSRPIDDNESPWAWIWGVFAAALAGSGLGACGVAMYLEAQADLQPVISRLDRQEVWQRHTLKALATVQANQSYMWTNGIIELSKQGDLLLKAQIKAGRLRMKRRVPDSSAVERGPVKADVAGSSPAPAAKDNGED